MKQTLYKTYINIDGSCVHMERIEVNDEEAQKLLNRSLKTCEEHLGVQYQIAYSKTDNYVK